MLFTEKNLPVQMSSDMHAEYSDGPIRERSLAPKEEASELELAELVRRAQGFDQAAIDELYNRFRGMIILKIKSDCIKDVLGEDAENIAWEIFYTAVQKMDISRRKNIAGYLKKYVDCELTRRINAETRPWEVSSINEYEEEGYQIADKNCSIESYLEDSILRDNVAHLSKDTRTLLRKYYYEGYPLEDCAKLIGRSYSATANLKQRALDKLRNVVEVNDYAFS